MIVLAKIWYKESSKTSENIDFQLKLKDFLSNPSIDRDTKLKSLFESYSLVKSKKDKMLLVITKTQLKSLWEKLWLEKNKNTTFSLRDVLNELIVNWKKTIKDSENEKKIEEKQINKTKDFIYQSSNKIIPKEIKISSNIKKESPNSWYGYDSEENYNIEEVNQVSPEDKKIIKKINQVEDLLSKIYSQRVKEMYNDRLEVIKNSNYFNELMNNELNILIDDINLSNRI